MLRAEESITPFELHETDINGNPIGKKYLGEILSQVPRNILDIIESHNIPSEDVKNLFIYLYTKKGEYVPVIDLAQIVKNISSSILKLEEYLEAIKMKIVRGDSSIAIVDSDFEGTPKTVRQLPKLKGNSKQVSNITHSKQGNGKKTEGGEVNIETKVLNFRKDSHTEKVFNFFMEHLNNEVTFREIKSIFQDLSPVNLSVIINNIITRVSQSNSNYIFKRISRGVYKLSVKST